MGRMDVVCWTIRQQNIVKHAGSTHAFVAGREVGEHVLVTVRDDGRDST